MQRRQILEHDLVLIGFRRETIDRLQFGQRNVALTVFWRPDLAFDGVTGAQVETTNLGGRDVNVVRIG
jgi:hypothetical protein